MGFVFLAYWALTSECHCHNSCDQGDVANQSNEVLKYSGHMLEAITSNCVCVPISIVVFT